MTEREQEPSEADSAEVPVEDALEQRAEVSEPDTTSLAGGGPDDPGEADAADRAEQGRVVDPGDDEYR